MTVRSKLILRACIVVLSIDVLALLAILILSNRFGVDPFFLFVPAVDLSIVYVGIVAGLFSSLFGILSIDYFILPPRYSIDFLPNDLTRMVWFLVVAAIIGVLSANYRRSQKENQRIRGVIDSSGDAVIGMTWDGVINSWSKGAENIFGYCAKQIKGRSLDQVFAPAQVTPMLSALQRIKQGEEVDPYEIVHVGKDNQSVDFLVTLVPNCDDLGSPMGVSVRLRDATMHKRTEEWLYNLSNAVENTSDVVVITDCQGVIEYVNPAFETTTGYTKEEVLGETPRMLKSGRHDANFYAQLWDTILSGKVFRGEFANRKKNGELYFELKTITPIKDQLGNITHFVSTGKDISDSARAHETLEQQIEERTRALTTLYDVTAVASTSLDLQTVLDQSLDRILTTMDGYKGEIFLLDENNDTMQQFLVASKRLVDDRARANTRIADERSVRWVVANAKPLAFPTAANDSALDAIPLPSSANTIGAFVAVPIMAGKRVKGVLSIKRSIACPFSADEVALLVSIGAYLGVTIEHSHLLMEATSNAARIERERLAHELHDSVTQNIYSSTLLSEAAFRFIVSGDAQKAKHYVTRLGEMAQQSLKEMRLLVYELRPLALENNNLAEALQQRLDAVEKRAGIDARLVVKGFVDLPSGVEEALYRVAQEALTNSLKHAVASSVNVELLVEGKRVELIVEDNGKGFDPNTETDGAGLGLVSMRKRVEQLGGTLSVVPRDGGGTQVLVNLPLQQ